MDSELYKKQPNRIALFPDKLGINNITLVGKLHHDKASHPIKTHIHKNILEIDYLYKGRQVYTVGNKDFIINGGDVFITYPDEVHGTGIYPEEKSILYWVQVDVEDYDNFICLTGANARDLYNELVNIRPRIFKGSGKLKNILDSFLTVYMEESSLKKVMLTNLITGFLLEVINLSNISGGLQMTEDIENVIKYINNNITNHINVAALARFANLSESRLKQKFKDQTGIPPKEFIWRKRIELAKELMLDSNSSLTEIAMSLNFGSSQYFNEIFKKFTGISPNQYRFSELCRNSII